MTRTGNTNLASMKASVFALLSFTVCILLCPALARAAVSYWDPEGMQGSYDPYTGNLDGIWESNLWSRNTDGSAGLPADEGSATTVAFAEGDAAAFCVGGGATNTPAAANTVAMTVIMNADHTISGIFDGSLSNAACMVTISGTGVLTLTNGFDPFNLTASPDGAIGAVTLNVPLTGPGILTAENSGGQIFLNASNTWTGGTQLGFSNIAAFTGIINFNNDLALGNGPIVIVTGDSGGYGTLQCTNSGVSVSNTVDFSHALSSAPFLNIVPGTNGTTFTGPWTLGSNAVSLGVGGGAANPLTLSGPITGTAGFTKFSGGTLVLAASNAFAGITTISAGTLKLGNANGIPSSSPVNVGGGAILDLSGLQPTFISLAGAGDVINSSGTLRVNGNLTTGGVNSTYSCFSGAIQGSGSLDKQGTHAMALRGGSTFSGPNVEVDSGILSVGAAANRLPTGVTLFMLGGTFQLDANNQTVGLLTGSGNINLGGGALTVNQSSGSSFTGVIRNSDLGATSAVSGNGLRGYYYDNEDFTSLKAVRDDANVNFANLTGTNAVTGLPPAFGTGTNQFSVRWLGQVLTLDASGSYAFTTTTDDGARLWVGGQLVVDSWADHGSIGRSGTINLAANTLYDIVMEYYNNAGGANAVLSWTPPGGISAVIPNANLLLPGAGALVKLGGGALKLSGVNTYTGSTIVGGGTLEIASTNGLASPTVIVTNTGILKLDAANALSRQTSLILNTNGGATPTVNLHFTGSTQLGQLSLDGGTTFLYGTWGGSGSGAQHISNRFTGVGQLNPGVCSSTNRILSITNSGIGTVTMIIQGTAGSTYYVVTHTNVLQPIANWTPVPGSTNTPSGNGVWSLSISNSVPAAAYRVEAALPCP